MGMTQPATQDPKNQRRRPLILADNISCNDITTASGLARAAEMEGPFAQFLILRIVPKPNKWSSLVTSVRSMTLAVAARNRSAGSRRGKRLLPGGQHDFLFDGENPAPALGGRTSPDDPDTSQDRRFCETKPTSLLLSIIASAS